MRDRACKISLSEMLTIMVLFHFSGMKTFKHFYLYYLPMKHGKEFGELPSYSRFIQLIPRLYLPLTLILQSLYGKEEGYYIIDSTHLKACKIQRESRHRVFKSVARKGKTTMGWFYGMKLHMVINKAGHIIAIKITPGNTHDLNVLDVITKNLKGKIYGDRGYISKTAFSKLYSRGLRLITTIRSNMKNYLVEFTDKIELRKRFRIETVFGYLKRNMTLWHTRHRSIYNAFTHLISACVHIK